MGNEIEQLLTNVYSTASLLALYIVIFFLANIIYSKKAGYDVKKEIVENDNMAVAVSLAGYLIAISIIFIGCVLGPGKGILEDLVIVVKYSALGIVLLYVAHVINDKLILYKFKNIKELVEDRNVGTGAVQAGSYIASGLIIAGSIHGEGGGLISASIFFLMGQVALILFAKIYNLITSFDVHDEIENNNYAAGIAVSGTLIALGIILAKAAGGDFISWEYNVTVFILDALVAFILLPLFRIVIDKLVISNEDLNKEIANDKNIGAGILEFGTTVGFAAVLIFVI